MYTHTRVDMTVIYFCNLVRNIFIQFHDACMADIKYEHFSIKSQHFGIFIWQGSTVQVHTCPILVHSK